MAVRSEGVRFLASSRAADRRHRQRRRARRTLALALVLWFGLSGVAVVYIAQRLLAPELAGLDPSVAGGLVLALILAFGIVSAPVLRELL